MSRHRPLAIGHLAQRARVLPGHARRGGPLFGDPGVVRDQGPLPRPGRAAQLLDPRGVDRRAVPRQLREQGLHPLTAGPGYGPGELPPALAVELGQHAGHVALQTFPALTALKGGRKGGQVGGSLGQRDGGRFLEHRIPRRLGGYPTLTLNQQSRTIAVCNCMSGKLQAR